MEKDRLNKPEATLSSEFLDESVKEKNTDYAFDPAAVSLTK